MELNLFNSYLLFGNDGITLLLFRCVDIQLILSGEITVLRIYWLGINILAILLMELYLVNGHVNFGVVRRLDQ